MSQSAIGTDVSASRAKPVGSWSPNSTPPIADTGQWPSYFQRIDTPLFFVRDGDRPAIAVGGVASWGERSSAGSYPLLAYVPACRPESLGDAAFCADHGIRYPYLAGAMANGIASEELVEAMSRAGMLAFFGAAGLSISRVEAALDRLEERLGDAPYGVNLIHSPNEPGHESAMVDVLLARNVRLIEASAYMALTLPVVRYRLNGIHRDANGNVVVPNRIVAKVSRVEVATHFMSPPRERLLQKLVDSGEVTADQAEMAREIPMADDVTAEADSGGHTDHRPAIALLPTLLALRDRLQSEFNYPKAPRVGLAGGISTPGSAAAAFAMGAAYIMTGSVNQACVESGTSDAVRQMLAEARQADVARAPAADMFEMGVTVQVLKRGTMFPMRANKLYELFRAHGSVEEIPADEREKLEKTVFCASLENVWLETCRFFAERDPAQIERAERDPKHKMALLFRSYLGQSSTWANMGNPDRKMDYQIWCGPAMGAFNEWTKGTELEAPENRRVADVARNILYGAAVLTRVAAARSQGIALPAEVGRVEPRPAEQLASYFLG